MKKIIKLFNFILPFDNIFSNVLFYLCLSPVINFILTNIYYINCGGQFNTVYDLFHIINPFNVANPICVLLITLISGNMYLIQYIYIIILMFVLSLIF